MTASRIRIGLGSLALVVLSSILSAAPAPQAHAAAVSVQDVADQLVSSSLKQGCIGPDVICDVGGDALDCAESPVDCGKDTAGGIKDGVGDAFDNLGGLAGDLPSPGSLIPDGLPACGLLDAVCDGLGGLPGVPGLPGLPGLPDLDSLLGGGIPGLGDIPNPFEAIGDVIAKAAADAWTAAMLAIWNSGLFVLRIVLTFSELFLSPDLRADGPGKDVYAFTLWLALALVVMLTMLQLGAAAFKREGKGLARAFIGAGQFVIVCACWFGYCTLIVAACGALTRALMKALLKVQTWPDWDPLGGLGVEDISDAAVATVLAFLGIFLWLAAIGHILVYLARAASLLVLTATGPLSAAGLVSDFTRSWFWKSLRWFHAAAFTPVLMVMVLGIGVQMSNGVATHLADGAQKSVGTALPAVMLILVSVVAPLALFKLLAFVDPGTPSGASFRQGMAIQGGVQGLIGGGASSGGSSAASTMGSDGRSGGEQSAETSTGDRFSKSTQGVLGGIGGVGQAMSTGLGWISSAGAKTTSLMSDQANQAGVGQSTYGPDFSGLGASSSSGQSNDRPCGPHPGSQPSGDQDPPTSPSPPLPPAPPTPPTLPPGGGPGGASPKTPAAGSGGAAGGAGAGAAGAAGGIPPVGV